MHKLHMLFALLFIFAGQSTAKSDSPTLRIGASGEFRNNGFAITAIQPNSPATKMTGQNGVIGSIEKNDVIMKIDGVVPSSHDALVSTLNKNVSGELRVDVLDRRTNNVKQWTINAIPTARSHFGIARDTYLRELRVSMDEGQAVQQIVSISGNSATNLMAIHLPYLDPKFQHLGQSSVELISQLTQAIANFKSCVIANPDPIWVDQKLLSEIDALIEPKYAIVLTSQLSEKQRLKIAVELYISVQEKLGKSFDEWTKSNGYRQGMVAGAPSGIPFLAKAGQEGARVELISRADMILTLLQNKETLNPLSTKGRTVLDGTIHWRRLPNDGHATAYGNYFYRLVMPQPNGAYAPQSFDPSRKFTIREQPQKEVIFR